MYRLLSVKYNIKSAFRGAELPRHGITSTNWCQIKGCCHHGCLYFPAMPGPHSCLQIFGKVPSTRAACSSFFSSRNQSTTTNPEQRLEEKKKKNKKYWKHYMELTEVTDSTASERRSPVKRLKAKKLQEFINRSETDLGKKLVHKRGKQSEPSKLKNQPIEYQRINTDALESLVMASEQYDEQPFIFLGKHYPNPISLDNPEQVQVILKSFKNFRDIIETIKYEKSEPLEKYNPSLSKLDESVDIFDVQESPDVANIIPNNANDKLIDASSTVAAKVKSRTKRIHLNEEQEFLAKERSLRTNLAAYLQICVDTGLVTRGLSTLLAYRDRDKNNRQPNKKLINIELYNILLHGFAATGSLGRIKEICCIIEQDGIAYNEQSFAAIFECLGRLNPSNESNKIIDDCIRKAKNLDITLNQVMDRSKFVCDQREIVLNAIQRIHPDFSPVYTPPQLGYKNELLNHLNESILSFDETEKNSDRNKDVPRTGILTSRGGYTKEYLSNLASEQMKIELNGSLTIDSIEKSNDIPNVKFSRVKLEKLDDLWRKDILAAFKRDMNTLKAQIRYKPNGYMTNYIYLKVLDAEQYVDIILKEIYKIAEGSETFSPTVRSLHRELGEKVQQRYQIEQKERSGISEKIDIVYKKFCEKWDDSISAQASDNSRQIWQRLVHAERSTGPSMDIPEISWPPSVLLGVGRFLYNILIRDTKINPHIMRNQSQTKLQNNKVPAFYTLFRNQGRLVKEEVKPHPVLARLLRISRQKKLTFDSNHVPMLCPPQPWSTPHCGGYLLNKSTLIRLPHQAIQQWERINSAPPQSIYPAFDSLNQLASIPWRINKSILDIIIEVFQKGGDRFLDVPQPPKSLPPLPSDPGKHITNAERAKLFKEQLIHRRKQAEMYSLWCDALYRLSLANHYRDKVFWLPHNMDFRGRVYPVPPHLSHLGSDLARSILIFDQAQPLGPDGFHWLKLHCINLTGQMKRNSVEERMQFVETVMDDILDSADYPLTGRMWWAKSDEPWQTLACCQEIARVQRSANPETYLCHFPIHQDGSCNGLQHYAALGRDTAGAMSVNLSPSERPQDVYSAVAALVEKTREDDAKNGLQVAEVLSGFVKRKVIKQTVMTTVYGVTRFGARLQIARQLKDVNSFPSDWVWPASSYLTTKTFESLREMFTSTKEIQDWFTESARLISGARQRNVEWCTPLGFPVVQPYSLFEPKYKSRQNTRIGEIESMDMYERPNVIKQKNAFPPNFIHSLDSSHMMLTSLHCERKGLTFVSVHDCFWTHASSVPDMNKICREQFVALHSQPILENLAHFLQETFKFRNEELIHISAYELKLNSILERLPRKGDFDLNNVLQSIYFFS